MLSFHGQKCCLSMYKRPKHREKYAVLNLSEIIWRLTHQNNVWPDMFGYQNVGASLVTFMWNVQSAFIQRLFQSSFTVLINREETESLMKTWWKQAKSKFYRKAALTRQSTLRDSSPKNENPVIIYPLSNCSKPVWVCFFCWTQKKIFWINKSCR